MASSVQSVAAEHHTGLREDSLRKESVLRHHMPVQVHSEISQSFLQPQGVQARHPPGSRPRSKHRLCRPSLQGCAQGWGEVSSAESPGQRSQQAQQVVNLQEATQGWATLC